MPLTAVMVALGGCGDDEGPATPADAGAAPADAGPAPTTSFFRDIKPIIDGRCVACHQPGSIGPFDLSEAEEVARLAPALANQVMTGLMPPWPPDNQCRPYRHDRSLSESERTMIQTWADEGAPRGEETDFPGPLPGDLGGLSRVDLRLPMGEAYAPQGRDDYRCFAIEWPATEDTFVTGFGMDPGNRALVHHVNMYIAAPFAAGPYRTLQNDAEGSGWPCFGGIVGNGINLMGAWAPGSVGLEFPEGTGIQVIPGSLLLLEIHYNTGPEREGSDLSTALLKTAPSVERRGAIIPVLGSDWPSGNMAIPANQADVRHATSYEAPFTLQAVGFLAPWLSGEVLEVHAAGLHMHYLGTRGRLQVGRPGGETECLLSIPDWDFEWQAGYLLETPLVFDPATDRLDLECFFDNTAENQPVIDGVQRTPADANWGANSEDEMCIGYIYVTARP